ncbi:MAG: alkaline phosphatase D family protein [Candidatus Sericytochromatia bacterium]|nr:alkaline phosphatase D family protein [Candidatus Sericytochromatia bacterium]
MRRLRSLYMPAIGIALACLLMPGLTRPALATNLRAGPMPGYPMVLSAVVWVQADDEAQASLEYWPHDTPASRHRSRPISLDAAGSFAGQVHVHGLAPGLTYDYRILLDGRPTSRDAVGSFRTLQAATAAPPDVTVAIGSCAYLPDPLPFESWLFQGLFNGPYGDTYGIFDTIAAKGPDLMVWLGDNLYIRPQDVGIPGGVSRRYWLHRSQAPLQALLRGTHHVALWDDHDMGWDNSDRHYWGRKASTDLFERYWANPAYGTKQVPGIFSVVHLYDTDIFLLDDRTYRDADASPDQPTKQMLGPAQLAWLQGELTRSTATFKLVCNGSQMLNDQGDHEGWHHFPRERDRFLAWLAAANIPGVVLLSGDRHHSVLLQQPRASRYPLYELTCSPLTSRPSVALRPSTRIRMVADTFVPRRNFGLLGIAGPAGARALTITICDPLGQPIWAKTLTQQELR